MRWVGKKDSGAKDDSQVSGMFIWDDGAFYCCETSEGQNAEVEIHRFLKEQHELSFEHV